MGVDAATKKLAERMFVKEGRNAPEISKALGVSKRSIYLWRDAGDWLGKRVKGAEKREALFEKGMEEAIKQEGRAYILSHVRRLELCAQFAEDQRAAMRDRLTAIRLSAELEGMQKLGEDEGPPTRFVVVDPGEIKVEEAKPAEPIEEDVTLEEAPPEPEMYVSDEGVTYG